LGKAEKNRKIGIMGGTFDPVHKGHLAIAHMALERCQLDEILFIPAFSPPHKDRILTSFSHRVAMLEAALEHVDRMAISILEAERSTPSYTVETLMQLHHRLQSSSFYLIMGADMFTEIEMWYRYRELFTLANIIVAARPGISSDRVASQVEALPGMFCFDAEQQLWCRDDGARIYYCPDVAESISSSDVRMRLSQGLSVAAYLTPPVREYIQRHGLYADSGAAY